MILSPLVREQLRLNANETSVAELQLTNVETQLYDQDFPALRARDFIYVENIGQGFQADAFDEITKTGKPKFIGNRSNDIPKGDFKKNRNFLGVKHLAEGYDFTIWDIREAARSNTPLEAIKAMAVREGMEMTVDDIFYWGDATEEIPGILSSLGNLCLGGGTLAIPAAAFPADGTGTKIAPSTKTALQNARDTSVLINSISTQSMGTRRATHCIVPLSTWGTWLTQIIPNTTMNVLTWLKQNFPYVTFDYSVKLSYSATTNPANTSGHDMQIAFEKNPMVAKYGIPSEFEQLPPDIEGSILYTVNCVMDITGVKMYKPKGYSYAICDDL